MDLLASVVAFIVSAPGQSLDGYAEPCTVQMEVIVPSGQYQAVYDFVHSSAMHLELFSTGVRNNCLMWEDAPITVTPIIES
jgi:hypothetical protein